MLYTDPFQVPLYALEFVKLFSSISSVTLETGVLVGVTVGVAVGVTVGVAVGVAVGATVGVVVGVTAGVAVGASVAGAFVGVLAGVTVGLLVGITDGAAVGVLVGFTVGRIDGAFVGVLAGVTVGLLVGITDGAAVGVLVGTAVCCPPGFSGSFVAAAPGWADAGGVTAGAMLCSGCGVLWLSAVFCGTAVSAFFLTRTLQFNLYVYSRDTKGCCHNQRPCIFCCFLHAKPLLSRK